MSDDVKPNLPALTSAQLPAARDAAVVHDGPSTQPVALGLVTHYEITTYHGPGAIGAKMTVNLMVPREGVDAWPHFEAFLLEVARRMETEGIVYVGLVPWRPSK